MMKAVWSVVPLAKTGRSRSDFRCAHTTVMGLFPPLSDEPRALARVLFRVEPEFSRLLIQSSVPASLPQLETLAGGSRTVDLAKLTRQDYVRYRLDFHAVARHGRRERPLNREEAVVRWESLSEQRGLQLVGLAEDDLLRCEDRKTRTRSGPDRLRVASFSGIARVADPTALLVSLQSGVGRAKSYGCGLLTVAPL